MGDAATRVAAPAAAAAALDRFFDTYYRQRPVAATFTGLHAHDARAARLVAPTAWRARLTRCERCAAISTRPVACPTPR